MISQILASIILMIGIQGIGTSSELEKILRAGNGEKELLERLSKMPEEEKLVTQPAMVDLLQSYRNKSFQTMQRGDKVMILSAITLLPYAAPDTEGIEVLRRYTEIQDGDILERSYWSLVELAHPHAETYLTEQIGKLFAKIPEGDPTNIDHLPEADREMISAQTMAFIYSLEGLFKSELTEHRRVADHFYKKFLDKYGHIQDSGIEEFRQMFAKQSQQMERIIKPRQEEDLRSKETTQSQTAASGENRGKETNSGEKPSAPFLPVWIVVAILAGILFWRILVRRQAGA